MGYKTIRDGETYLLRKIDGTAKLIVGPKRIFVFRSKLEYLRQEHASGGEYLKIVHRDGRVEHQPGPISMVVNPMHYIQVSKHQAHILNSNEVLVIYRPAPSFQENVDEGEEDLKVKPYTTQTSRMIIRGPVTHIPEPDETIHTFKWHGVDPANKTHFIPNSSTFERLTTSPTQFYYNVRDVRTADDAQIVVKIMIFYEIVDIEKMLDSTADPIADMINSACADVIAFCAVRSYEDFLKHTRELNSMASYEQLTKRTERIGLTVSKVVYRGYHGSEELQGMHNAAIEQRTRMRLQADEEEQRQRLADFTMEQERARFEKKRALEEQEQEHRSKLANMEAEAKVAAEKAQLVLRHEMKMQEQKQMLEYYGTLSKLGVDLTQVLVAQHQMPDRIIRLEGSASRETTLNLHEPMPNS